MREIKFRAWDKVDGIWCNYKIYDGRVYFLDTDTGLWYTKYRDFDLMQYIGVNDINNVEIYEGDIVEMSKENSDFKEIGVVKFDENKASFLLITQDNDYEYLGYDFSYYDRIFYKVIGNIYEHKDLLKQENK